MTLLALALALGGVAGATPRAVAVDGGPLAPGAVVRIAFEGVPASEVTLEGDAFEAPFVLEEVRCTSAKDPDTTLCVFRLPEDLPFGDFSLRAEGLATSVEIGGPYGDVPDSADPDGGASPPSWSGVVQNTSAVVSQRYDADVDADVADLDSTWSCPAAPTAGYLVEFRDETGRPIDWLTAAVDQQAVLVPATSTEALASRGELCIQPVVYDPRDVRVWDGNRMCFDMPDQPDPACRGCAAPGPAGVFAVLLGVLGLLRRREQAREETRRGSGRPEGDAERLP